MPGPRPPCAGLRPRYEDLVADPQGALARIGATVGLDLDAVGAAIAAGGTIAAEHQVAGSRIRMTGAMTLRPDMGWQRRMSPRAQAVVAGLCGARMRRYGYAAGGTGSASA